MTNRHLHERREKDAQQWNSVEDRLPGYHEMVLAYLPGTDETIVAWRVPGHTIWEINDGPGVLPSHWMPFPERPAVPLQVSFNAIISSVEPERQSQFAQQPQPKEMYIGLEVTGKPSSKNFEDLLRLMSQTEVHVHIQEIIEDEEGS
jgi:hypothetical protein